MRKALGPKRPSGVDRLKWDAGGARVAVVGCEVRCIAPPFMDRIVVITSRYRRCNDVLYAYDVNGYVRMLDMFMLSLSMMFCMKS